MKQAFSLVELSIVLVILGLLVGGILTGQSLIRAAELRSVTREYSTYQTAAMTFRDKYFALPGDMTNATDFWGVMTNCGAANPSGTGTQTCDGDGDGQIENAIATGRTGEMFGLWQQLANAGLVEGAYNGIAGASGQNHSIPGENVPTAKISSAGWGVRYEGSVPASDGTRFEGDYGNAMYFGTENTSMPSGVVISPEEAWNIDKKMDDGLPETGTVRTHESRSGTGSGHCSVSTSAQYALANTGNLCSLIFLKSF